jgi:hypothetical protein
MYNAAEGLSASLLMAAMYMQAAEEAGEVPGTDAAAQKGDPKPAKAAAKGGKAKPAAEDPAKYPSKDSIGPFCAHLPPYHARMQIPLSNGCTLDGYLVAAECVCQRSMCAGGGACRC